MKKSKLKTFPSYSENFKDRVHAHKLFVKQLWNWAVKYLKNSYTQLNSKLINVDDMMDVVCQIQPHNRHFPKTRHPEGVTGLLYIRSLMAHTAPCTDSSWSETTYTQVGPREAKTWSPRAPQPQTRPLRLSAVFYPPSRRTICCGWLRSPSRVQHPLKGRSWSEQHQYYSLTQLVHRARARALATPGPPLLTPESRTNR